MSDENNSENQSTEEKKTEEKSEKEKKTPKKKGPIRFEAVIPFFIFVGLASGYYSLFFDSHLKAALELAGSYFHGAEVNIGSLNTSIRKANLRISGIEVTNAEKPDQNLIALGEIRLAFNWDALLRAKLVVDDSGIEGVQLNTPRKSPGKLYLQREKDKAAASAGLDQAKDKVLKNTEKELEGNIFGDAAALLGGGDPSKQLGEIRGELETEKKLKEIEEKLNTADARWKQNLKKLPNQKKLNGAVGEIKKLKFDIKNPKKFAASLKKGQQIIKTNQSDFKQISAQIKNLNTEVKDLENSLKELDQAQKNDIAALQSRIQIPELDTKTVAQILFGQEIRNFQNKYGKYINMAREYMPEDSGDDSPNDGSDKPKPKERAKGRTLEFATTKSYPQFWLKQMTLSSVADTSEFSGNMQGKVSNFSSNPKLVADPGLIELAGDFPKQKISGIKAKITVDHRGDKPFELIDSSVSQFPVGKREFSKSSDVQFGFDKAQGASKLFGRVEGGRIDLKLNNVFTKIAYYKKAKQPAMQELLNGIASDVKAMTVNAHFTGRFKSPNIAINSNLASAIGKSFKRQLNAKIAGAKAKMKNMIDSKVKSRRAEVENKLNGFKKKYQGELAKLKKTASKAKSKAQAELDKAKKSKTKGVENKLKKEAGNLLKKLNF